MDNVGFTEIFTKENLEVPKYLGHDDPYKRSSKRKLSKMETQAKFEDLRKR